jgi:hypothetical protein
MIGTKVQFSCSPITGTFVLESSHLLTISLLLQGLERGLIPPEESREDWSFRASTHIVAGHEIQWIHGRLISCLTSLHCLFARAM